MRRLLFFGMAILLLAGCARPSEEPALSPTPIATPTLAPTLSPTPAPTPEPENPIRLFVEAYAAAVEPYTALLDAPVELVPESFQGLLALAQHPVRLQKMLHGVSALGYDGAGRWSIGAALPGEQAASAGVEEIRAGYAFNGYTEEGFAISGTLKDGVLECTWLSGEGRLAAAEVKRLGDDWRCVVYLDETADGVWIEGDALRYTTDLAFEDCLDENVPLMMDEPSLWDTPYLKVQGQSAAIIDPDEIQGEQET